MTLQHNQLTGTANQHSKTTGDADPDNSNRKLEFGNMDLISGSSNSTTLPVIASATGPAVADRPAVQTSADEFGAPRICALCNKRFSHTATNNKVLFKHIVTIRRHWDPNLLSKDVQMLEQGTSMFNLVNVCVFCNQYFFPDFPNGIFFPLTNYHSKKKEKLLIPDPDKGPVSSDAYFDTRYVLCLILVVLTCYRCASRIKGL